MGIASIAKTGLNYAGRLIFDDRFATKVTSSLKNSASYYKRAGKGRFYRFDDQIGRAFKNADKYTANKKIFQSLKDSLTSYGRDTANLWKGKGKLLSKLSGTFKGLFKRAPLIGTVLMLAFELPNIFKATKDGGIIQGAAETGKSAVRIAAGIACGAIGTAILGVGGSIAGFIIGDMLGKPVVGKSYSEKKAAEQQKIAEANNVNPSINQTAESPKITLTPQDLMLMQQMLYNNPNDDFLYNATTPFKNQLDVSA